MKTVNTFRDPATTRLRPPRGMSLLEIMIVITLIGLVTAAIGVAVMNQMHDGQEQIAQQQAQEIAKAVELFELATGRLPTTAEGLTVLTQPQRGRPLLTALVKDPWGNDYAYRVPSEHPPQRFDVMSNGSDGAPQTADDVGNWLVPPKP